MARFSFDAFVSYAHEDLPFARRLVGWLRNSGFQVWFDIEQLVPGVSFRDGLMRGIRESRHLISLLTPSYVARKWTQREVELFDLPADQQDRRILGIEIGSVVAGSLDQIFQINQRIQWKGMGRDDRGFWKLYCGLANQAPGPEEDWASNGKRLISGGKKTGAHAARVGKTKAPSREISRALPAQAQPPVRPGRRPLQPARVAASWACVGPSNIGGRATCLACDPNSPDLIWLGSASGGVWKSEDGGRTWRALWHKQETLNIGSLAVDPANPALIYCGTGEANGSADSYPGAGIYRSADGGTTWELIGAAGEHELPGRIGSIAIDPFDSHHICIGGATHSQRESAGMWTSEDGGATWKPQAFPPVRNCSCHGIVYHPARRGVMLAAIDDGGDGSGIWRSRDGGAGWEHLHRGLPAPNLTGRISLAIAPSKPDIVYALVADRADSVLGLFVSSNMGSAWKRLTTQSFRQEWVMSYANTIAVDPEDHRHVLWGGGDLYETRNGGKTWRRATHWDADRGTPKYAHARHHDLLFLRSGLVYDANDGGLDVSVDGGRTWSNRSNGLAITAYYGIAVAAGDSNVFGGGTQGTGTCVTENGRPDQHVEILGGDGGWMAIDPADAGHFYASYYNLNLYRWRLGTSKEVSPPAGRDEKKSIWMAVITMDPSNSDVVFTGSQRIWRTKNDGKSWSAVTSVVDGSAISAIEVATADPRWIYAATEKGTIIRSMDGGETWSGDLAGGAFGGRIVTRIRTSPADARIVFAALGGGFGGSHVFRSLDGGVAWCDVDQGRLPNVPQHALSMSARNPKTVFLGGNAGAYVSSDLGKTWRDLTKNLPNTMITDLVYHEKDQALFAGTWGRSIWRIQLG